MEEREEKEARGREGGPSGVGFSVETKMSRGKAGLQKLEVHTQE